MQVVDHAPGNPLFNISGSSHESANTVHSPYRRGNNGDNENGSLNLSLSPINLADTDSGDEQQQHKQHEEEKTEIKWMFLQLVHHLIKISNLKHQHLFL